MVCSYVGSHCCQVLCPESSFVLLWPYQSCRFVSGPLPSSADLHFTHPCRLEMISWPSQTFMAYNCEGWLASTESWLGDSTATRAGQRDMAATCDNIGSIDDKLLKEQVLQSISQSSAFLHITSGLCEVHSVE